MNYDISKMDGYEFENFIADLLRKMGFDVEENKLSGDGGVDLIAYSKQPVFRGKYLVQCKKWEGSVGEPPLRDLYGVVLSNNANKGVMITNSSFTMNAIEFADGKNLELIDGSILKDLVEKYYKNDDIQISEPRITHFTNIPDFELSKYKFYKQMLDSDKKSFDAHLDLFNFLYSYVLDCKIDIMYSGLLIELVQIVDELIKRFGFRGKKGEHYKKVFSVFKGTFYMLLGKVSDAVEILVTMKALEFNKFNNTVPISVMNQCYFYPHRYYSSKVIHIDKNEIKYQRNVLDYNFFVYKVNLVSLLHSIKNETDLKNLVKNFNQYYDNMNEIQNNSSFHFESDYQGMALLSEYNNPLVKQDMQDAIEKGKELFFLPMSFETYRHKYSGPAIKYSIDKFLELKDINAYWSVELDFEAQNKNINFLFNL
ncbi:MAG: restriction endonuclease [Tissierellia bacterium]|nr:restriction endonuclease [Tissierellia bacterium]